ncbi:TetR/AcrR family transcriptional regulator [Rhodococcus sp. ACS1]|uniref:TetR/AcrR family transcriptional regulator n=1 Tax=Rhodococcus sp. ACS1 TaxID=2028570 RepID=UPI0015C89CB4|nr:TetR/AcrR family transcriptional regulator [Rhodococcus sp. ACS1]
MDGTHAQAGCRFVFYFVETHVMSQLDRVYKVINQANSGTLPQRLGQRRLAAPSRQAIIDAVRELLTIRRLDDLTVQEIVDRAQMSRPTFYSHFDTKYSVVAALIADMGRTIYERWNPFFEGEGPIEKDTLRHVSLETLRGWREHATLFSATIEGWHSNQEIHDTWNEINESFRLALTARLAKARPLEPGDDMLTAALISLCERCVYLAIAAPDSPLARSDEDLADVMAMMLTNCLRLPDGDARPTPST